MPCTGPRPLSLPWNQSCGPEFAQLQRRSNHGRGMLHEEPTRGCELPRGRTVSGAPPRNKIFMEIEGFFAGSPRVLSPSKRLLLLLVECFMSSPLKRSADKCSFSWLVLNSLVLPWPSGARVSPDMQKT